MLVTANSNASIRVKSLEKRRDSKLKDVKNHTILFSLTITVIKMASIKL